MQTEKHYNIKSGWIRAAVLGANDGILSTSSLAVGVAAAGSMRQPVVLAALAGIVAGALSMAAGEYVSVSSQADIEHADLQREKEELASMPEAELEELAAIYRNRGLDDALAHQVAVQLTANDALAAHARDELGINEITQARPLQAAVASCASFITGGVLPLLVAFLAPMESMVVCQYVFFHCIHGIIRPDRCEGRGFIARKSGHTYLLLGHAGHGRYSAGRIPVRCTDWLTLQYNRLHAQIVCMLQIYE